MCPIVPMFTCGFVRSYFALAMAAPPTPLASASAHHGLAGRLRRDLLGDGGRHFLVACELHGVGGATLRHRTQGGRVPEHLSERDVGANNFGRAPDLLRHDAAAPA